MTYIPGEEKITFPFKAINGYDNGRDVFLVYKTNSGKRSTRTYRNYPWYFCIENKYRDKVEFLSNIQGITIVPENDKYTRIYCWKDFDHKDDRLVLRQKLEGSGIPLLEFDCSLSKRFMIDNQIEVESELVIGFFDIETDDSIGNIEIGRDRIISWAFCNQKGETEYFTSKEESDVLSKFLEEVDKYDVIVGWNSQEFDLPYIKERMRRYDMKYNWKRVIEFDLMKRLIKLFGPMMTVVGLAGFSLEEVSRTFLGEGKIKHTEKIFELERDNQEKLKEYNIMDTVLLHKLDKKLSLFDLMIKECAWTGTFLNRFYVGELLDNYILREARKQDKHLPSQREWSKDRIQVKGAYVMPPVKGFYDNMRVFDFKSLYPSIIVTWNISHDTYLETEEEDAIKTPILEDYNVPDEERTRNQYFYSKRKGIYSDLIKYLLEMRKGYKKQQMESEYGSVPYNNSKAMQEVVKELSNSMYGITADPNARFFNKKIAESITLTGQYLAKKAREYFQELGYQSYYGDTDSMFIQINDDALVEPTLEIVNQKLKEHIISTFNVKEYIVYLDYEKTFNPIVLVDKKRYSGLLVDLDGKKVNKMFTRGLEVIKKDTIGFTRRKMGEMLNSLIVERKSLPYFAIWIEKIKEEVLNNELTADDLKIAKKISRPICDYKTELPHVRLAKKLIADRQILETVQGKHVWGQKIEYIVTNYKRTFNESMTSHPQEQMQEILASDFCGVWDRTYYWNVQVYSAIKRILETAFPSHDWEQYSIITKKKRVKKSKVSDDQMTLL